MHESFIQGKSGLTWWFGKVEANDDPEGMGRCRVRVFGWHSDNKDELPDIALPWAYPITDISNSAVGGTGKSPTGPVPGTRVMGFFADGLEGQVPMMLGTVPGATAHFDGSAVSSYSTPRLPLVDRLLGFSSQSHEGDNISPDNGDSITVNAVPVTRTQQNINPSEWCLPFTGFVSSPYGARGARTHHGVDICPAVFFEQSSAGASHLGGKLVGPTGLPVYAAADGVVVYKWTADKGQRGITSRYDTLGPGRTSGSERSFGNAIAIKHTLSTGTYTTIYAHLGISQDPALDPPGAGIDVKVGDTVKQGQKIGSVGRSHCWDSPTHLHFEISSGAGLPKSSSPFHPGEIFPQLWGAHSNLVSVVKSGIKHNEVVLKSSSSAPVQAKARPSV